MIRIIYTVSKEEAVSEVEWLKEQRVYPSLQDAHDWSKNISVVRIGAIVNKEAALAIKLRHKLDMQVDYKQR